MRLSALKKQRKSCKAAPKWAKGYELLVVWFVDKGNCICKYWRKVICLQNAFEPLT